MLTRCMSCPSVRHKHQVKYISEVKTLDRMFYHVNNFLTEAMARESILKSADDYYDTESDDYDDVNTRMLHPVDHF